MKKLLISIFLAFLSTAAAADQITFEWDYGQETAIDGFNLYSGPMGQDEAGNWLPKFEEAPLYGGIPAESRTATVTENGWPGVSKKFGFAIRSFKGANESADSNIVYVVIDNTPLAAPADPTGAYNPETGYLTLNWTQADISRAKFWRIYYRMPESDTFTQLGRVDNSGQETLSLNTPLTVVPAGRTMDLTFAVVAFKNDDVFSPNSSELLITIDRTGDELPAVENFRIKLEIEVR